MLNKIARALKYAPDKISSMIRGKSADKDE